MKKHNPDFCYTILLYPIEIQGKYLSKGVSVYKPSVVFVVIHEIWKTIKVFSKRHLYDIGMNIRQSSKSCMPHLCTLRDWKAFQFCSTTAPPFWSNFLRRLSNKMWLLDEAKPTHNICHQSSDAFNVIEWGHRFIMLRIPKDL